MKTYSNRSNQGFTILELLVVIGLVGIMTLIAAVNLRPLENPVYTATHNLAAFMKQARARAVSTTSAYEVRPTSNRQIAAFFGPNCASIDDPDNTMTLEFSPRVSMPDTDWAVCFTARGLSTNNVNIEVSDGQSFRSVEVLLGGVARIQ